MNDNTTRFKSILVFFDLLRNVNQKEIQYVKQLYLQRAQGFEECIDFISSLKLIHIESGSIKISDQLIKLFSKQQDDNKIRELILNKLLNRKNDFVWKYLEKFSIFNNRYIFEPRTSENLRFSNLRNLLIELEFISYNANSNNYEISEDNFLLFVDGVQQRSIHPDKLKRILEEKEKIGKQAELAVFKFEKSRLSSRDDLSKAIIHKSLEDSSAGYDIKSFTLDENIEISERFIEVKAVSKFETKFYFTRNELETSKRCGLNYYLYLVPVIGRNEFDLDDLEIIQDPSNKVFNSQNWEIENELFSIKRKEEK